VSYSLAHRSNTAAEFWVVFSRLQAGGFHPFAPNFHHGTIAAGYILAFGGYDILLLDAEMEEAREWMRDVEPLEDFDPIKPRPIRDVIYACILARNPFFALFLLPPVILLIGWLSLMILQRFLLGEPMFLAAFLSSSIVCIIGILADARHKAEKKKRPTP